MKKNDNSELVTYLKAMGDAHRLAILGLLKHGPRCVCEIFPELAIPQNLASHHLKVLRDAHLVVSNRLGTKIVYSLQADAITHVQELVASILL